MRPAPAGPGEVAACCPDCDEGWEHCHGGVILHRCGEVECMLGPSCTARLDGHVHVEVCTRLEPPCECTGVEDADATG